MKPETLTRDQFLALLADLQSRVETGDSFGGHLEYEAQPEPHTYAVTGMYRIDNTMGQGGMRVIGTFEETQ